MFLAPALNPPARPVHPSLVRPSPAPTLEYSLLLPICPSRHQIYSLQFGPVHFPSLRPVFGGFLNSVFLTLYPTLGGFFRQQRQSGHTPTLTRSILLVLTRD